MNFNTKLNIGDPVWYISIREGHIKETTIIGITVTIKPCCDMADCEDDYTTSVVYHSRDNHNFADENEGKYWWATRKGIIDYLTRKLTPVGNGKKSNPIAAPRGINEEFEEFFGNHPKPPQEHFKIVPPPMRSTNKELRKVFEDVFGKPPSPPVKKTRCDCGVHRISGLAKKKHYCDNRHITSELVRRMKPLPGIREKTISDLYDELFES